MLQICRYIEYSTSDEASVTEKWTCIKVMPLSILENDTFGWKSPSNACMKLSLYEGYNLYIICYGLFYIFEDFCSITGILKFDTGRKIDII